MTNEQMSKWANEQMTNEQMTNEQMTNEQMGKFCYPIPVGQVSIPAALVNEQMTNGQVSD